MSKLFITVSAIMLACVCIAPAAQAQGMNRGPDASTVRDQELEKDSMHNLEVARHYFKLKKAYRAAIARCEEIIAANPNFSKMDEVLYIAGVSSLRLAENRGKQAPNLPPDKLRDVARIYMSRVVKDFPDSPFKERAESELRSIGGVKPKEAEQKTDDSKP